MTCEDCGAEIPAKRLAATRLLRMPDPRLCVACQSAVDRRVTAADLPGVVTGRVTDPAEIFDEQVQNWHQGRLD